MSIQDLQNNTLRFQWQVANTFAGKDVSKNIMSHFLETASVLQIDVSRVNCLVCRKCCSIFHTSNYTSRLEPKKKLTKKDKKALQRLSKRRGTGRDKNRREVVLNSKSTLKIKCLSCGFNNKLEGASRAYLTQLKRDCKDLQQKPSGSLDRLARSLSSPASNSPLNLCLSPVTTSSGKRKPKSLNMLASLFKQNTSSRSANPSLKSFLSSL